MAASPRLPIVETNRQVGAGGREREIKYLNLGALGVGNHFLSFSF